MLHVTRDQRGPRSPAAASSADYGYVLHWPGSGESSSCGFHEMPGALLRAGSHVGSSSDSSSGSGISSRGSDSDGSPGEPLLSGPLWLGPLHSASHLTALRDEAASRGWLQPEPATPGAAAPARTRKGEICSLHQLLELLLQEAEAEELAAARGQRLPPWFVRANDVGRAGALVGPPARAKLQAELQRR